MATPPPPPPPPSSPTTPIPPVSGGDGGRGASRTAVWQIATVLALVVGLIVAGVVYVVMDDRADQLRAERDDARRELAEAQEQSDSGLGGLEDLLGGSEGGLGGLEDLLGGDRGGLEDLLGDLGGMGDIDPILYECLGAGGMRLGGGDDSIPDGDVETQVAAVAQIVEEERGLPAGDDVDI